jgi:hypothetical protein
MNEAIKASKFRNIIIFKNSNNLLIRFFSSARIFLYVRLNRKNISRIYMGDWRSEWMHRCVEISNLNSVTLLDDGIIIVDILKK